MTRAYPGDCSIAAKILKTVNHDGHGGHNERHENGEFSDFHLVLSFVVPVVFAVVKKDFLRG
ncbi:MAG: hypothetical protein LBI87_12630 [Candidatus Accumulibacter sp.]|nr:hypothetical protein [Accumulibacter sp.]